MGGSQTRLPALACLVILVFYGCLPTSAYSLKGFQRFDQPGVEVKKGERVEVFESGLKLFGEGVTGAEAECEESYGVLPCSTSIGGNLFLLLAYGYLMLKAAQCLSEGSELLLAVLNPGLVGGLLLPILGCLPDAILIAVSGLSASVDDAADEVLVGMGLLAGSTVMLLTLLWGTSLVVGRCDLEERHGRVVAVDKKLTKGFNLFETGVTTDNQTRVASWIMIVTVLPFLIAQSPRVFGWSTKGHLAVLIGGIVSLLGLIVYCTYQVFAPWIQARRQILARERYIRTHAIHRVNELSKGQSWGDLVKADGTPNHPVFTKLFGRFDVDHNGLLSTKELKALIVGISFEHDRHVPSEHVVLSWMSEFDLSKDGYISQEEFILGMGKWLRTVLSAKTSKQGPHNLPWSAEWQNARNELALLDDSGGDDEEEEDEKKEASPQVIVIRAILLIALGAIIAGVFADPLVSAITNFSNAAGISPFFVAFVATPLATNSSEAISSILFAKSKRKRNISMTYSQVYGGVTMNNTLCLAIFLAVVYVRGLVWDFSSEVIVIVFCTVAIGILASFRTTFPLWTGLVALAIYPISIALVAILDSFFGWQ